MFHTFKEEEENINEDEDLSFRCSGKRAEPTAKINKTFHNQYNNQLKWIFAISVIGKSSPLAFHADTLQVPKTLVK